MPRECGKAVATHRVAFRPTARDDLTELYDYIADHDGLSLAGGYIDRIEAACLALQDFPLRGARRDDIRLGLRVMGFERRASIVFTVQQDEVEIVRVLYGGRDLERILRGC